MPNVHQAFIDLYRQLQRAMVDADTFTLNRILSTDFHLVHMTGYDQTRAEWLAHMDNASMRYFSSREEAIEIDQSGPQPTLIGRNLVSADIWGMAGTWRLQLALRFVQQDGRWQIRDALASTY